jgi:hypothetical protein
MIFKLLPNVKIAWSDVWVGASLTSLLFTVGKVIIGFLHWKECVGFRVRSRRKSLLPKGRAVAIRFVPDLCLAVSTKCRYQRRGVRLQMINRSSCGGRSSMAESRKMHAKLG